MENWKKFKKWLSLKWKGKDFCNLQEIINRLKVSDRFEPQFGEEIKDNSGFITYDTYRQRTWAVFSNKYLYFVLDDKGKAYINLRIDIDTLKDPESYKLLPWINGYNVASTEYGIICFGENSKAFYSKSLFQTKKDFDRYFKMITG